MNEEEVLVGRIQDLAEQCYHRDVPSHTEFLTLAEQDLFYRTVNKIPGVRYVLSGGYEAAERKAALFLPSYAEDGDASMLPIAVVRISPLNEKFADALSHRDFLGSLMNLGVERYKLGDIDRWKPGVSDLYGGYGGLHLCGAEKSAPYERVL